MIRFTVSVLLRDAKYHRTEKKREQERELELKESRKTEEKVENLVTLLKEKEG